MEKLTAVVLGATGLIGEQLVQQLLSDMAFSKVRILVRRQVDLSHPKLEVKVVNFDDTEEFKKKLGEGNFIFCCIGTTNRKVKGNKAAYRKVDFDIPVNAARIGKDAGFKTYILVSAVGANARSSNFYLKMKGEVEREIAAFNFASFYSFRPSILYGKRKEFRVGESIGRIVMQAASVLLVGSLKKYRGIEGSTVAKAMVAAAKSDKKGYCIYHYPEIVRLLL